MLDGHLEAMSFGLYALVALPPGTGPQGAGTVASVGGAQMCSRPKGASAKPLTQNKSTSVTFAIAIKSVSVQLLPMDEAMSLSKGAYTVSKSYKILILDAFDGPFERYNARTKAKAVAKVRSILSGWMEKGDKIVSRPLEDGATGFFIQTYRQEELDIFAALKAF